MRRAGIRCPTVVKLRKHVLVMSFIGSEGIPALKIQETNLDAGELQVAYDECIEVRIVQILCISRFDEADRK